MGLTSAATLLGLLGAAVLLGLFALVQRARPHSLLPSHLLRDRTVVGADVVGLLHGAAIYTLFYVVSLFTGEVLGYGALRTGLALLPVAGAIAGSAALAGRLLARVGPRPVLVGGPLLTCAGLLVLARITPAGGYATTLLPGLLLVGAGLGPAFVALTAAAVGGVDARDNGIAAGLFTAGQQIGGALGLAGLAAISTAGTRAAGRAGADAAQAATAGWALGLLAAAGAMLLAAAVAATLRPPGHLPRP